MVLVLELMSTALVVVGAVLYHPGIAVTEVKSIVTLFVLVGSRWWMIVFSFFFSVSQKNAPLYYAGSFF